MESKLVSTINYLQYIDCTHNATKKELQDRLSKQREKSYVGQPENQLFIK